MYALFRLAGGPLVLCLWTAATMPATAADDYAGKTVELVVGAPPGGGYDIYARAVGRHLGRHIPGEPDYAATDQVLRFIVGDTVSDWSGHVSPDALALFSKNHDKEEEKEQDKPKQDKAPDHTFHFSRDGEWLINGVGWNTRPKSSRILAISPRGAVEKWTLSAAATTANANNGTASGGGTYPVHLHLVDL